MILIRHGQSEFNVHFSRTGIDPGITDPHLTEAGRTQVRTTAEAIRRSERPIVRVVTSPYTRALQTAEILADVLRVPVDVEPLVREHAMFQCDVGTCRSALSQSWPALKFDHLEETWWPALDESEADVIRRARSFQLRAATWIDWREVAVVSHWGFLLRLTGKSLANAEHLPFDPTG
ncbi:histidine phosphatase family protein [Dongia deserti]|uniref:histidine phosphatase family protein n=1 Tax=Dongia deserti TaxID=2268030 RepID=UPI000E6588E6|nr:histidine phosphatase family protein [Dongia deserti]